MFFFFSLFSFLSFSAPYCNQTEPYQMLCPFPEEGCTLDQNVQVECTVFHSIDCEGDRTFMLEVPCRFCYQLPENQMTCDDCVDCHPSIDTFFSECRAQSPCLGNSLFQRKTVCKAADKSQKAAFLLSLFLGAFGADRFYLGHYVTASFKLATIGGLGIAYMIDLFLILFGYLGPADGKLYLERV